LGRPAGGLGALLRLRDRNDRLLLRGGEPLDAPGTPVERRFASSGTGPRARRSVASRRGAAGRFLGNQAARRPPLREGGRSRRLVAAAIYRPGPRCAADTPVRRRDGPVRRAPGAEGDAGRIRAVPDALA